jgi:hypothetical protein
VIPEWLQYQDSYNEQYNIPDQEKGLKYTVKKIAHSVVQMIFTKLRKGTDIFPE